MKKLCSILLIVIMVFSVFAFACCNPTEGEGNTYEEDVDPNRTQVYVYNFNGGYGTEWLAAAKKRYEEIHKNDTNWETGKTGVQIMINPQKTAISSIASQVLNNKDEVYFTEFAYYYSLKNEGIFGDITSAVTGDNSKYGDMRTIESKLSQVQKDYFGVNEGGETHYYGLPHYAGYYGLTYNVELFEKKHFYFAETPGTSGRLSDYFSRDNNNLSAGPDGVKGTDDDGLPATYDEFFVLCEYIVQRGYVPLTWNGAFYNDYLDFLLQALATDYEGIDQMMLNYKLEGTATNLATVQGNSIVDDETPTVITTENAYELARQKGKYYALSFLKEITETKTNDQGQKYSYHHDSAFNGAYSHMNAQEDFIYAGIDGATTEIAMLCDGSWWQMEISSGFDDMVSTMGSEYSKQNRKFGFMPLPKANAEKVEEAKNSEKKYTLYDSIYSICFMKANVEEWKKPLILDFISFINSDESLCEFTKVTDTVKALDYDLSGIMDELTPYGKSLAKIIQKSNIVYPYSNNNVYVNNEVYFSTHNAFKSKISNTTYARVPTTYHDYPNITALQYFSGIYEYMRNNWVG